VISEDDEFIVTRDPARIVMRNRRDGMCMPDWLDYPVHRPRGVGTVQAERLQPDAPGAIPQPGCAWNLWNNVPWVPGTAEDVGREAARSASEQNGWRCGVRGVRRGRVRDRAGTSSGAENCS